MMGFLYPVPISTPVLPFGSGFMCLILFVLSAPTSLSLAPSYLRFPTSGPFVHHLNCSINCLCAVPKKKKTLKCWVIQGRNPGCCNYMKNSGQLVLFCIVDTVGVYVSDFRFSLVVAALRFT